ncbi:LOW QUALITY PROTEIN: hypothetical protein HID58_042411, partial [Brassica napus]
LLISYVSVKIDKILLDIYLDGTRRPSHPPRLPNQTEKTLPLLIHPVNPFIKSINHDLAFNASLRCISEYIKVSLLLSNPYSQSFSGRPGMRWRTHWVDMLMSIFIKATVYKHLIKAGSIYSISGFDVTQSNLNLKLSIKWRDCTKDTFLQRPNVKKSWSISPRVELGEPEAELYVIKAINKKLQRSYN